MIYQTPLLYHNQYYCDIPKESFASHWHNESELIFCREGSFATTVDGQDYTVREGQLLIINSTEVHDYRPIPGTRTVVIEFGRALLGQEYENEASYFFSRRLLTLSEEGEMGEKLLSLIRMAEQEVCEISAESGFMLKGCICQLAALLYRHIPREAQRSAQRDHRIKHIHTIMPVIEYVDYHYGEAVMLADVAALAGYERKSFCRLFRRAIGMSFHSYLNEYRIRCACAMLTSGRDTIADIGVRCGFSDPAAFSKVFRQYMGQSPRDYRRSRLPDGTSEEEDN